MTVRKHPKISISIPTDLLSAIDERAARERRSRSNMICVMCEEQLAKKNKIIYHPNAESIQKVAEPETANTYGADTSDQEQKNTA